MPIDHDRKFIFVHIPKTAGTSVLCSMFGVSVDGNEFVDSSRLAPEYQRKHLIGNESDFTRMHHYPLRRIAESPLQLSDYFVFAFVRNPFDRLVSEYHFLRLNRSMPFNDFVLNLVRMVFELNKAEEWFSFHFLPQLDFVSMNGKIHCDFLGRFESLVDDYGKLCRALNVEYRPLPAHKKSVRGAYHDYYNAESRALVEKYYKRDLDAFGYDF